MTVEEAKSLFEAAEKIEQEFADQFTAIIQGLNYEDVYERCKEVIAEQAGPTIWVPSNEPL
jgi:hypothetical protein